MDVIIRENTSPVNEWRAVEQEPDKAIAEIASFLGYPLTSEEVSLVVDRTRFFAMKENPLANRRWWDEIGIRVKGSKPFMRKGRTDVFDA